MEEELLSLLQVKLEQGDGEDQLNLESQELDDISYLFFGQGSESDIERMQVYSENMLQLCIFTLICCLTNVTVLKILMAKKVNLNKIFGFRANSLIIQHWMQLLLSISCFVSLEYIASLLEIHYVSVPFVFLIKYVILLAFTAVGVFFYYQMKSDGIFFLSQIKYQKDVSFIMVFLSDQLQTIAPLLLKSIYLVNFLFRFNIPTTRIIFYGLVLSKVIRMYQCIKLYILDPMKNKDLLSNVEIQNCIKNFLSLMCVILDQFLVHKLSIDYGLLMSHVCYSIYTFYWDVYEDWQLNINSVNYFSSSDFKKRKPLFSKYVYLTILFFSYLVRLNWAVKYIFNANHHEVDFYIYCFEITRRSLWSLLKLESESYLLMEKSDQKNNKLELELVSNSVNITIDEISQVKQQLNKEDKRND